MGASALKRSRSRRTAAFEDEVHPDRLALIGVSEKSGVLYTVFAEVADDVVRIITARKATTHERRRYEEEGSSTDSFSSKVPRAARLRCVVSAEAKPVTAEVRGLHRADMNPWVMVSYETRTPPEEYWTSIPGWYVDFATALAGG
jgi:uncharacterized DUF497 family protein